MIDRPAKAPRRQQRPQAKTAEGSPPGQASPSGEASAQAGEGIAETVRDAAFERIFGPHLRRALQMRGLAMAGVFAWCLAAWWLWPRPSDAPHAQGAWLPLLLYLATTVVVAVAYLVLRRFGDPRLPDEAAFPLAEAAR